MRRENRLQESFELRGEFWRPEEPGEQVSGILKYEGGRIELGLLGVFGQFGEQEIDETEIIVGQTNGGPCTLSQAIRVDASWSFGGGGEVAQSVWVATLLFVGGNFEQIGDANFAAMAFGFEELEAWLAHPPFEQEFKHEQDQQIATPRHEFPPLVRIPLPSQGATLSIEFTFSRSSEIFRSITWTQDAAFKLAVDAPQPHDWFMQQMSHLRALLGLLLGEAATPTSIVGALRGERAAEVTIYFQAVGQARDRKLHPAEMILSRDKLGDRLTEVFQKWFEKQDALASPVGLLFGTLYWAGLPSDFQFLALTQALETFHRRTRGGRYVTEAEYSPIETALVASLPSHTPSDLRQALKSRIKYGNEFSQRRRFKELLDSQSANRRLVTSDDGFVDAVVDQRNYLTHYPQDAGPPMSPREMFNASVRLRTLLTLLMLAEVGIAGSDAAEGVRRSRWHRGFVGT